MTQEDLSAPVDAAAPIEPTGRIGALDFTRVNVGPMNAIYQARFNHYLHDRRPELYGALHKP